ncbi:MAG: AAA family ATPase [Saprospiraceae bacterium]|nr:AAA family ATPase [Saprospiraceae bacterium]
MSTGQKTGNGPNFGLSALLTKDNRPDWAKLRATDWFAALYNCPQEPDYHTEGNVGIHTEMVVAALLALPEYADLTEGERTSMLLAALLHDVAKPACTVIEDGKISSPRHAKVGEKMAREILWDLDFELREMVCSLVRLHGLPLWSLEKQNPWSAVIGASLRVNNRLTYLLAKADVLGRICADQAGLLERCEYFRAFCEELECFGQPRQFHNSHSKFRYFFTDARYPAELFDDTRFTVEILSGLPGSGKDTYLLRNTLPVVSLDDLRREMGVERGDSTGQGHVIQRAQELAKQYAAARQPFIWNATNLTTDLRSKIIGLLSVYNPFFKITYLETSLTNVFARRKEDIPRAALERMSQMLELPLPHEVHEVSWARDGRIYQ